MLLRKANVVEGALKFLDDEGLDALTMRKLSSALNVQGGALYRHFPSKESLLDAMADKLVEGVAAPLPDIAWPDRIRVLCHRFREALLTHRDGARVVAGTYAPGSNTITGTDVAVTILCEAGLPPAQAGWLTFALFYYVLGCAIEEQALIGLPADDDWRSRNARQDVDVSPEYQQALESLTASDPDERFAYGLSVFIDGIVGRVREPAPGAAGGPRTGSGR